MQAKSLSSFLNPETNKQIENKLTIWIVYVVQRLLVTLSLTHGLYLLNPCGQNYGFPNRDKCVSRAPPIYL